MASVVSMTKETKRYVLFPIKYETVWKLYKKQLSCFWVTEEIDLSQDINDWNGLEEQEKSFIKNILAFFAVSDGIVMENLAQRFMNDIEVPEIESFYGLQITVENIHAETYSLLIDTYIKDEDEKKRLFNGIEEIDIIKNEANWALEWINKTDSLEERLFAFCIVEGLFFSGSFCAIFWLEERGLMPGLSFSNELISRDEELHTDFGSLIYSMCENELSQKEAYDILIDAVNVEKEFINESLEIELIGMNKELMCQYIEYIADQLLEQLGYDIYFKKNNPFEFMNMISIEGKTNFFEERVSEYKKCDMSDKTFSFDAEF